MVGKSAVSVLGEFCAKKKMSPPKYECINAEDSGYVCEVTVADHFTGRAQGRSKRDAKHLAADGVIKQIRLEYPEIDEIPLMEVEELPSTDMVCLLRDFCVQKNHPLPELEIVQQGGTPDAPRFVCKCTVASLCRYGESEKKKDARQKAAYEMLRAISNNKDSAEYDMQLLTLNSDAPDVESERYKKFKSYFELIESKTGEVPGTRLCDRHNYFKKFDESLKKAALNILYTDYESYECKVNDMFEALKIKPKVQYLSNATSPCDPIVYITLNCDYDAAFAGSKDEIYQSIVVYFQVMLT